MKTLTAKFEEKKFRICGFFGVDLNTDRLDWLSDQFNELLQAVKERDEYVIGAHTVGYIDRHGKFHNKESAGQEIRNELRAEQRQRAEESL